MSKKDKQHNSSESKWALVLTRTRFIEYSCLNVLNIDFCLK